MKAKNLSKQRALNAHPKATQQVSFTVNLVWAGYTTMLFIIEEVKKTILDFAQGVMKVL